MNERTDQFKFRKNNSGDNSGRTALMMVGFISKEQRREKPKH